MNHVSSNTAPQNPLVPLVRSTFFTRFILGCIVATGLLAGLETYPKFRHDTPVGGLIELLQQCILWIFVAEAVLKIAAFWPRPWRYFLHGWNLFDFVIVLLCFLPIEMEFAAVLRLARILRALRLVSALPRLQLLVSALLKAIPSLGYVGVLLGLHFYVYAVMGTFLFRDNDPMRFGTLHKSMLTLFQVLTLEGWNDVLDTQYFGSDLKYDDELKAKFADTRQSEPQPAIAAGYFVTFILLGTMIMLNLFTGVIIGSMEDAQAEASGKADEPKEDGYLTLREELKLIHAQLQAITNQLGKGPS